jgi:hypothetical protein
VPVAEMPQHLNALARANRVRLARTELKRKVAADELAVADIADPITLLPWRAESMSIFELLAAQHRWGALRVRTFLGRLSISEGRPLANLTPRQRSMIVTALRAGGISK